MSASWIQTISRRLEYRRRVVVLGVGNDMKGDDAAGLMCADELRKMLKGRRGRPLKIIKAFDVPENFTGGVRAFRPDAVIIVDSALSGRKPGSVFIVEKGRITEEDISTHRIPLLAMVRYLETTTGADVTIIGIQPETMEFGAAVSAPVLKAVTRLSASLARLLSNQVWESAP